MSIKVLPSEISNQIAAGEVVERPASVVKECVENALDAGARNIEVHITDGGKTYLSIIDDGIGMSAEDLPKATLRHATSKISTTDDLFHLQQYGFRGEALAAVSSVSDFTLVSRTESQHSAQSLKVLAGETVGITEEPGNVGTTVTVKNLFAPTPARLEYLKSDDAEYRACVKEMYGFALGNSGVSFKVFKNDKLSLDYPATDSSGRVSQVLKKMDLVPVNFEAVNLSITGFVSAPGAGLSHRNQQYLLVNGRRIEDHRLAFAVREAYVQSCGIEKHLHPVFALSIEIDPILVDVNVHPRKLEVKFAEPGEVFSAVKRSVVEGLEKVSYSHSPGWGEPEGGFQSGKNSQDLSLRSRKQASAGNNFNAQLASSTLPSFTQRNQSFSFSSSQPNENPLLSANNHQLLTLIGQADNKYIVAQNSDGLYFFDQHALHERQRFEQFWQAYKAAPLVAQPLLVPDVLTMSETDISLLHEHKTVLTELCFVVEFSADDQLVINEMPELLVGQDAAKVLQLCVEFFNTGKVGENVIDQVMRKLLEYKACRGAVMFGDHLEPEEMKKLIADFDRTDWKLLCPHGRPNHHFVPFTDLDKKFHR